MATLNGHPGTYKFYLHHSLWRIKFFPTDDSLEQLISEHDEREEALRETYRLNGWGEPKPRNKR